MAHAWLKYHRNTSDTSDGDSVKPVKKSVQSWLDMCTQKGEAKLTLCIRASAEARCELLSVVPPKVYYLL